MPVFHYLAADTTDRYKRGTLNGESPRTVRDELRGRGLRVLEVAEEAEYTGVTKPLAWGIRNRQALVAAFCGELSTLLSVGVPLLEGLETLARQHKGRFQVCLQQLIEGVRRGRSLAEAMRQRSDVFDELCASLTEVGENTGRLDQALDCVAQYKRKSLELSNRVLSALLYPAVILAASIGVSVFLMTVVVPMLLENLADLGKPLPWPTRVLKSLSEFLVDWGLWLLIPMAVVAAGLGFLLRSRAGRRWRDRVTLKLPLVGMMVRKQELSRLALVMSTLLSSGLEFLRCLAIARQTTRNTLLAEALDGVAHRVENGRELGSAIGEENFFTPLMAHVFTIGQKTGKLDSMLLRISEDYDRQVNSLASRLAVLIEPAMILLMAVIVGFILFATLLPILEAGNVL